MDTQSKRRGENLYTAIYAVYVRDLRFDVRSIGMVGTGRVWPFHIIAKRSRNVFELNLNWSNALRDPSATGAQWFFSSFFSSYLVQYLCLLRVVLAWWKF